jgi:hypothetical protein
MRIEDATQTVGGHPVRIYATDGGGDFPVHGAIWVCTFGEWVTYQWSLKGGFVGRNGEDDSDLNLDLHDWRDEIPWKCLRDDIQWVARQESGRWVGFVNKPLRGDRIWVVSIGCGRKVDLEPVKMPTGPADWREAIAKRPET